MKRWALIGVCILVFLVIAVKSTPCRIVTETSSTDFVFDLPFKEVQKMLILGKFERENLRINNAEVLEKKWLDKSFLIQRPFKSDRHWEIEARLLAKVRTNDPKLGKVEVDLVEDILFGNDRIEIITQLGKPLSSGVSSFHEEIIMTPLDNKTAVSLKSTITVQRFISWFAGDSVSEQVKGATEDSVRKMEIVIRSLKTK